MSTVQGQGLKEFLDRAVQLGAEGQHQVCVLPVPGDPHGAFFQWDKRDGNLKIITPDPKPRNYTALSVADVIGLVKHFYGQSVSSPEPGASERKPSIFVWVGDDAVRVVLNERDRRNELITFKFNVSDKWTALEELVDRGAMSQIEMIDYLRTELCAKYDPPTLVKIIRQIKFNSQASGDSTIQVGKESISKSVQREVIGAEALPEDVTVTLPIYENVFDSMDDVYQFSVVCSFDVDTANQAFKLTPKAGELDRVKGEMRRQVQTQLEDAFEDNEGVRVFCGLPIGT